MKMKQTLLLSACALTTVLWTGCTSPMPGGDSSYRGSDGYIYKGINFGPHKNDDFKKGIRDACRTAEGFYTKNHSMFNNNESYRVGWEDGRLKCKGE